MNKVRFLLPLAIIVLLSSCSGIIDPTQEPSPDTRLTGEWSGEVVKITTETYTHPVSGVKTESIRTETITETYTFYNNSKIEREQLIEYTVSENNGAVTGSGSPRARWEYQWRSISGSFYYRTYTNDTNWHRFYIDLNDIGSDVIEIDGFVLKKVR